MTNNMVFGTIISGENAMDKNYIRYRIKRIESAINDYTTMSREDLAEYVLTCLEYLMEEYDEYKKVTGKSE